MDGFGLVRNYLQLFKIRFQNDSEKLLFKFFVRVDTKKHHEKLHFVEFNENLTNSFEIMSGEQKYLLLVVKCLMNYSGISYLKDQFRRNDLSLL